MEYGGALREDSYEGLSKHTVINDRHTPIQSIESLRLHTLQTHLHTLADCNLLVQCTTVSSLGSDWADVQNAMMSCG